MKNEHFFAFRHTFGPFPFFFKSQFSDDTRVRNPYFSYSEIVTVLTLCILFMNVEYIMLFCRDTGVCIETDNLWVTVYGSNVFVSDDTWHWQKLWHTPHTTKHIIHDLNIWWETYMLRITSKYITAKWRIKGHSTVLIW